LKGEHISEFKQRQIDQQHIEQTEYDDNQLKPAEGP
jgi:multicomponent K+:H+ antiporter subunit D